MEANVFDHSLNKAASLLKALSSDRRLMIVCELAEGEKSVGELEARVGVTQSALSQHLARLRKDGIVQARRESQHVYYSLADPNIVEFIGTLAELYCRLPDRQRKIAKAAKVVSINH